MNQGITITISGLAGVGKSTMAQALSRTLKNVFGFTVTVVDEDDEPSQWSSDDVKVRMEALIGKDVPITVVTQQAHRGAA